MKSSAAGFSCGFAESTGIAVQALIRLTSALIILLYIFASDTADTGVADAVLPIGAFGCLLLASALIAAGSTPVLRFVGLCADVTALSLLLCHSPHTLAPLYLLYLVIATAYGFRYGEAGLLLAAGLSAIGFALVIATTPFWQDLAPLSVGLLLGLLGVPLYNLQFIRKVSQEKLTTEHDKAIKSELMANMSHGLRTPVNTIVGLSYLLQNLEVTGENRKYLETLRMAAKELEKETDQALSWFRLGAGSVALFNESFDLYKVITECVHILHPQADAKGLPLQLRIDPRVPYYVEGDSHKLGQVLMNLISNAIKFTQRGVVEVSLTRLEHRVATATLCFMVKDTGIGIPEARKRAILEPYCQADAATARDYGGSGLGTAIARKTVEAMGGDLWFQSVQDRGTIFWVKLPFRVLIEPDPNPLVQKLAVLALARDNRQGWLLQLQRWVDRLDIAATLPPHERGYDYDLVFLEASAGVNQALRSLRTQALTAALPAYVVVTQDIYPLACTGTSLTIHYPQDRAALYRTLHARALWKQVCVKPMVDVVTVPTRTARILVADDNVPHQLITRRLLEQAGHQVAVVGDGRDALDALRTSTYDLAIVDSQMPRLSGLEALRRYRDEAGTASIPVIVTSADIAPDSARRFQEAGAAHYLTKPLKPEMLLWVVSHTLEQTAPPDNGKTKRSQENATPSGCHTRLPSVLDNPYLNDLKAHKKPLFMETLIASVRRTSDQALADLEHAIADQDQAACQRALHALANAAAAVGAETLCRLCHEATSAIDQEWLSPDDGGWLAKIKKAHNALGTALANEASHR